MLEWHIGGVRYRVSLLFPALITALLLCRPDGWTVSCLMASLIHEGGHLLAMLLVKAPPRECVLGAFGLRIRLRDTLINYKNNLIISLAGPCVNGVSAAILFMVQCPTAAVVHLSLAVLNLIPVVALDGGEVVRCVICLLGWEAKVEWILRLSSVLVLLPMSVFSFCLFVTSGNPTLLIIGTYLVALLIF